MGTMTIQSRKRICRAALAALLALCSYRGFFFREEFSTPFQASLLLCGLFLLYWRFFRSEAAGIKLRFSLLLSVFLGFFYAMGKTLFAGPPLWGRELLINLAVMGVGFSAFYYMGIHLLYWGLERLPAGLGGRRRFLGFMERRPVLYPFLLLLLLWLPHLILKYPCGMNWDSLDSIDSGLGVTGYTANQPVVYTLLLTAFVRLGLLLGSANIGLFVFVSANALALALVFACCFAFEAEIGAADWSKLASLLFFAFSPFVLGYVGVCVKDMVYMVFFVMYTILLGRYSLGRESFWGSRKYPLLFLAAAVGMWVIRNNGKLIVVPTVLVMLFVELRAGGMKGRRLAERLSCLLGACVLPWLIVSGANRLVDAEKPSPREALSLPFQQTARLALEHPEQISPEEAQIIDKLLDFDSLAADYDPDTADPVKNKFKETASGEDILCYLKVWFRQFFREPFCYLQATLAQNYYLFYPEFSNTYYYYSCVHYDFKCPEGSIHIGSPAFISDMLGYYYQPLFRLAHELPLLYVVNNMSTYCILLLFLLCFVLKKADKKQLLILLPALLTVVMLLFAPCIRNHVRYAFPVIYSCPLLYAVYTRRA